MKDWPVFLAILLLFILLFPTYEGLDAKQIEQNDKEMERITYKRYPQTPESVV